MGQLSHKLLRMVAEYLDLNEAVSAQIHQTGTRTPSLLFVDGSSYHKKDERTCITAARYQSDRSENPVRGDHATAVTVPPEQ